MIQFYLTLVNSAESFSYNEIHTAYQKGCGKVIGNRLREQRKKAHLTQAQLGAQLHLSKNSISNYERNQDEPPDDTKIKLAKILGVSVDYLTGASDNPSPYVDASNTVRLPAGMPPQAWDELRLFIDYLKFKYLQHKEP